MIEAVSDIVEVYKISKSLLLQFFGGSASEVIYAIRGHLQNKKNWLIMKQQEIARMKKEDVLRFVQFKDENEFKGLNPVKDQPGETPYLKSMLLYGNDKKGTNETPQKSKSAIPGITPENGKPEKKEEQKKRSCLRELPKMRENEDSEDKKYDKLMGHGTMRLVASNRMEKGLTQEQMRGYLTLRGIAQDIKGGAKTNQDQKGDFRKESINKFKNSVMSADPEIANKAPPAAPGGGMSFFRKMQQSAGKS